MRNTSDPLRKTLSLWRGSTTRSAEPRAGKIHGFSLEVTGLAAFCMLIGAAMLIGVGDPVAATARSADPAVGVREIVNFSASGPEVALRFSDRCLLWNPNTDHARSIWLPPSEHRITALAGSPIEPQLLIGRANGWLTLLDVSTQTPIWEGIAIDGAPTHAIFSPDGNDLAIATNEGQLLLLDTQSGKIRWKFRCGDSPLMTACFSVTGDQIFTVVEGTQLISVDTKSGQLATVLADHISRPSSFAVTDDGQYLAIGTFDGCVILWDLIANRECYRAEHSATAILAVLFDRQEEKLFYAATSGTIGAILLDQNQQRVIVGTHQEAVPSLVFHSGALVSGSFDGEVRAWSHAIAGSPKDGAHFTTSQALAPRTL